MINVVEISLIQFEVFDNGDRLLGLANVTLPEFTFKTVEVSGAGISGSIDWPLRGQTDNMTATFNFRVLYNSAVQFLRQDEAIYLSCRGAKESYDSGTGDRKVTALRIDLRGHTTKLNLGKMEPGAAMDSEVEFAVDRINILEDGVTILERDLFNNIHNVGGTDYLSAVRRAVGL